MSTKTTKKAVTRKAQPKKAQPEVTPMPKLAARRARGAAKLAEAAARRPVPQPPVKADAKRVSGDAIPAVSIATMTAPDRIKAAKAEHASLREWASNGKKGTPPTTPVLNWLGENPSGSVQRKSAVRKAKGTSGVGRSGVCTVLYFHDGVQQGERYNSLSNLAYYTGGKGTRLTSGELRTLLAKNGIDSPETTAWEFTAPNGVVLSAKLA